MPPVEYRGDAKLGLSLTAIEVERAQVRVLDLAFRGLEPAPRRDLRTHVEGRRHVRRERGGERERRQHPTHPFNASAPETISISSLVIAAWRARFIAKVRLKIIF